ncbi:lipid-A-disaccharide synthase-related protein [Leptothoe sp. PORK10 BA2]|uniref:lipid-A-disaccharide synthase-related protein n=1 Tax=Leptothoe sp. PORK10 BA2 TaxID=3110254 RepID=UPI002B1F9B1B|nr:lipid-A-disaccharide synthase-related protein [Leptothoe sp. PORK10 BA2]MEA5463991.1 lipid-A-disaccharide synthase-related protein [Leptothoe sp. PORK10 BA2]
MPHKLLFISNGHGEDNHSSHIIRSLRELSPELDIAAAPIVGQGHAYRNINVPIVAPTLTLPSGGFTYTNRLRLINDIRAGLLTSTWRQLQAIRRYAPQCDLVFATGDVVGQCFAYLSGRPFISFTSPLSAIYEGTLNIDIVLRAVLKSSRCLILFSRDAYTAKDYQKQGFAKAQFGGIPSLDRLKPKGKDLQLAPHRPMMALLPGSRIPEAMRNLKLLLGLVVEIATLNPQVQFRAALVSDVMADLDTVATEAGWHHDHGTLTYPVNGETLASVICFSDAFNDIVCQTTLVLGMAGLAVDQAMAIGKPILQIPGAGPQFTYAFAEAQDRLLGLSVKTIGTEPATPAILKEAAQYAVDIIQDEAYLQACIANGQDRFGPFGASYRIAHVVLDTLRQLESKAASNS